MSTEARYRRHPAVRLREDGEGAVALHEDSHQYFELNGSALTVWRLLDEHPTIPALSAAIASRHEADAAEVDLLLRQLLPQLEADGLVVREGGKERRRDRIWRRLKGG